MFIDVTMAFRNRIGRAILSAMTGSAEARASAAIRGLADDPRFSLLSGSPWPFLRKGLSFLLRSRIVFRIVRSVMSPKAARASAEASSARLKARVVVLAVAAGLGRLCSLRHSHWQCSRANRGSAAALDGSGADALGERAGRRGERVVGAAVAVAARTGPDFIVRIRPTMGALRRFTF